jgi:ADP-ribose pyrophosphatase
MFESKIIRSERIFHGRIIDLTAEEVEEPNGKIRKREIVNHPGGGAVVPLLDNGDVILVNQYRYPLKKYTLELPAGKLEPGEDPIECAKRELSEETGYSAARFEKLTALLTTPGFCDELLHIYLATGLKKTDLGQQLDEGEHTLSVKYMPFPAVIGMIERGEIQDSKTIAGILLAERRLKSDQNRNTHT